MLVSLEISALPLDDTNEEQYGERKEHYIWSPSGQPTYQSSQLSRSRRGGVAAEFSTEFRVLGYVAVKGESLIKKQQQKFKFRPPNNIFRAE